MKLKTCNITYVLLLGVMVFSQFSCKERKGVIRGDGNITSVVKELEPARNMSINFSGMGSIFLMQGERPIIQIDTDQNIHQYLNIEQRNGELHLFWDEGINIDATQLKIIITYVRELENLNIAGAVSVRADHTIVSDRLNFDISGAADIDLNLDAKRLETSVAGSGRINLSGSANTHKINLSGATFLDCIDLKTEQTTVNLSGAGSARVYANKVLEASISGIGKVTYGGNPVERKFDISGLGKINPYTNEPH